MSPRLHRALRDALAAYVGVAADVKDSAKDEKDYEIFRGAMEGLQEAYFDEPTVRGGVS